MLTRVAYVASALLLGVGVLTGVTYSSAGWTDSSTTTATVGASPDWTPPTVSVDDPGAVLDGTRALTVTAGDVHSSVASVEVQHQRDGASTWTSICVDGSSPWGCSWDTTTVTDGVYRLRAVATDAHANTATSATISREVVNTAGVTLDPVPTPTRGEVRLTARAAGPGSSASTIAFQYATGLVDLWTTIPGCEGVSGPAATCDFQTAPGSGTYHLRARATFNGSTHVDVRRDVVVDNAAPAVALSVPGTTTVLGYTWVDGTITLTATASDDHTSVASVLFEHRAVGAGSWITCVEDTSSPYSCTLDTSLLAEGSREFRATGTDALGNVATTATQTRYVDRRDPTGTLRLPGTTHVPSVVTVRVDAQDAGTGVQSVLIEHKTGLLGLWTPVCTDSAAPYECTTLPLTDGALYSFRATVTDNRGRTVTTPTQDRTVDTTAPTVSQTVPSGTLSGTVAWTATAGDDQSGIVSVTFQHRPTGTTAWSDACVDTATPFACSFDTTALVNGSHDLRAVATNGAGATVGTTLVTRTVTNGTASITAPTAGATVLGPTTVTATATAPSGVASVTLQYRPSSAAGWVTICTDGAAPYTCSWATASLTAGSHVLQAISTATNGGTVTSAPVTVTVERFRGASVAVSTTGVAGLPDAGDQITLTYTNTVDLASVRAGWDGAPTGVALSFNDSSVQPGPATADWIGFAAGTNLGQLSFSRNYVSDGRTVTFGNATMAASTTTWNGRTVTVVTVTLGAPTANAGALNVQRPDNATSWYPSASVVDTHGTVVQTTTVVESSPDPDF